MTRPSNTRCSAASANFRINTRYTSDDTFDQDVVIERVPNPLAVYPDCYSTAADSSDWNYCFVTDTMTKAAFKKAYPGAEEVDWEGEAWSGVGAPWRDDPCVLSVDLDPVLTLAELVAVLARPSGAAGASRLAVGAPAVARLVCLALAPILAIFGGYFLAVELQ